MSEDENENVQPAAIPNKWVHGQCGRCGKDQVIEKATGLCHECASVVV